ncbi:hypothetical protein QIW31_07455 [Francisellaceae bacterium CB299]
MRHLILLVTCIFLAKVAYSSHNQSIEDNLKEDIWSVEDITYHIDNRTNIDFYMNTDGHHDVSDATKDFFIPSQSVVQSPFMHATLYNWFQELKFKSASDGNLVTFAGYYTDGKHKPDFESHKFNYEPTTLDFEKVIGVRGRGHFFYNKDALDINVKSSTTHDIQDLCPDPGEVNAGCPIDVYSTDIYITINKTIDNPVNTVDLINDSEDILTMPTMTAAGDVNTSIPANSSKRIFLPITSNTSATDKEGNIYTLDLDFNYSSCSVNNPDIALSSCSAKTSIWDNDVKSLKFNTTEHDILNIINTTHETLIFDDKHHQNITLGPNSTIRTQIYMVNGIDDDYILTDPNTNNSYHLSMLPYRSEESSDCFIYNPDKKVYYCSSLYKNGESFLYLNNDPHLTGDLYKYTTTYTNHTKYKLTLSSQPGDNFELGVSTFWHPDDNMHNSSTLVGIDNDYHSIIITGKNGKQYEASLTLPDRKCKINNPDKDLAMCMITAQDSTARLYSQCLF